MNDIPEPPIDQAKRLTAIIRVPEHERIPDTHDIPSAFCVETIEGHGGCMLWGWYERHKEWIANPNPRWLVTHLLTMVGELYDPMPCREDRLAETCREHVKNLPCPHRQAKELFE